MTDETEAFDIGKSRVKKIWIPTAQRSFAQPAACLHVPAKLTPEPTSHEARKRRASERHAVGCCEELGGADCALSELALT